MLIGKLAALTGATRKAIRHYEAEGLLPEPQRRGSYRVYGPLDVHLVGMLRRAQRVGFTLAELKDLAAQKAASGRFPLPVAQTLIAAKRQQFDAEIRRLQALQQTLDALEAELVALYQRETAANA